MKYEERVAWLSRYRESMKRERMLEQEMERLEKRQRQAARFLKKEEAEALLAGLRQELEQELKRSAEMRGEVCGKIEELRVERQRELMRRRYVLGQTFEELAEDMYLDPRWCRRLHKAAVESLEM
ncbi:MAG: hypothetical protein IIV90_06925 [Oscillospiraceae bacterium]|nr:hypothetical protein [Oscillospiraceae bacterium]